MKNNIKMIIAFLLGFLASYFIVRCKSSKKVLEYNNDDCTNNRCEMCPNFNECYYEDFELDK